LSRVTALADTGLLAHVPHELLETPRSFIPWCAAVLASQPPNVDTRGWKMASAVRTLTEGRSPEASARILVGLLRDSLDGTASPEEKLRALDQATLVYDAWEPADAHQFLTCYDRIGRELADQGNPQPFTLPAASLRASALWSSTPIQTAPLHLVRAE